MGELFCWSMKKTYLILLIIASISLVLAHQPRVDLEGTLDNPIQVEKPEVSKAYYGELTGNSEYYEIDSETEFLLYLNILAPDIEGARRDFIVEVLKEKEVIFTLKGDDWEEFYEPFGGDSYLQGPELEEQVSSGVYLIKVSNTDNSGKYSLAVGKIESFPPFEIIKTIFVLPKLKKDFFNKSPLTAYFNLVGLFLLIFLIIIAAIIFAVLFIIKKRKR
jgi:hypothetical protein